MKVTIELEIPETLSPFDEVRDALGALLAFKRFKDNPTLPDVSIKAGKTSLTMTSDASADMEEDEAPARPKLAQVR